MLQGEWQSDGVVVAGDVAVYRDLIADRLGVCGATIASVGDAEFVVVCANGQGVSGIQSLASEPGRKFVVVGVPQDQSLDYFEAGALCVLPPEAPAEDLCEAVHRAANGQETLSERQTTLMFQRLRERKSVRQDVLGCLTSRESLSRRISDLAS